MKNTVIFSDAFIYRTDATGPRLLLKRDTCARGRPLKFLSACLEMERSMESAGELVTWSELNPQFARHRLLTGATFLFLPPYRTPSLPVSRGRENGIVNYGCVLLLATRRARNLFNGPRRRALAISLKARLPRARVYLLSVRYNVSYVHTFFLSGGH